MLTPKQSNRKRYELEQWVTLQRNQAAKVPRKSTDGGEAFSPSATQVRHFCTQVGAIVDAVNRKADEIREQLYQRSQDQGVKKQQKEGYQSMNIYKKALGIGASKSDDAEKPSSELDLVSKKLENVDIIDHSTETIKVEEQFQEEEKERKIIDDKSRRKLKMTDSEESFESDERDEKLVEFAEALRE